MSHGDPKSVIVIGAGAAGLAAAQVLAARGVATTVIEARDRIGGRVWTNHALGPALDLGASWIQGTRRNPITTIVEERGILTRKTDWDDVEVHDPSGAALGDAKLRRLRRRFNWIEARAARIARRRGRVYTVEEAMGLALAGERLDAEERRILDWMIAAYEELPWGVDAAELALREDEGYLRGGDVLFPGGYDQVLRALAEGVVVRLREVVRRIAVTADHVRVETDRAEHSADHAIVTLPLGVLKRGLVTFSPALPARKQAAIDRLAMGALDKIALIFPRVFWPEEREFFGWMSATRGEVPVMMNLARTAGVPGLLAFVTGRYGRHVAGLSDAEVQGEVMRVLRAMFGAHAPDPVAMVRTNWGHDPYAFGSYAHIPISADPADMDILAEPVGRLGFAGEATHRVHSGTVHGALLSGRREAERILGGPQGPTR